MQNYCKGNWSWMAPSAIITTSSYSSIFLDLLLTCPIHPYHAESLASGESLASVPRCLCYWYEGQAGLVSPPPLGAVQLEIFFLDSDPRSARLQVMSVVSGSIYAICWNHAKMWQVCHILLHKQMHCFSHTKKHSPYSFLLYNE